MRAVRMPGCSEGDERTVVSACSKLWCLEECSRSRQGEHSQRRLLVGLCDRSCVDRGPHLTTFAKPGATFKSPSKRLPERDRIGLCHARAHCHRGCICRNEYRGRPGKGELNMRSNQ